MPPILYSVGLIALGLLPSLVWLVFYFREDCHPEPKHLIARAFLMGIIISPIAIILQYAFIKLTANFYLESIVSRSPGFFLWSAFIEEFIKFYAIKLSIMNNPEFDEPIDAMIYMVAAGLGFAGIENILITFQTFPDGTATLVSLLTLRFIGATLLHALSSALLGYFLAMAWFFRNHHKKLIIIGLTIATIFHFTFNMLIASFQDQASTLVYTTALLLMMAFLVSILFGKMRGRHPAKTHESIQTF